MCYELLKVDMIGVNIQKEWQGEHRKSAQNQTNLFAVMVMDKSR